jgi:hypothetical protein
MKVALFYTKNRSESSTFGHQITYGRQCPLSEIELSKHSYLVVVTFFIIVTYCQRWSLSDSSLELV